MTLASAYPNSALSVGALVIIAFVALATLAFWLIMVFIAARPPHARQAHSVLSAVPDETTPAQAAEDNDSEADSDTAAHQRKAVA